MTSPRTQSSTTRSSSQSTVRLEFGKASDKGGRSKNEDSVSVQAVGDGVLAIVADGMGGGLDGKRFSETAVARVQATVLSARQGLGLAQIDMAVRAAARELKQLRDGDPRYQASGTTLVTAGIEPGHGAAVVSLAHVGDSRAYHISATGAITQITVDHIYAETLIRTNVPREEAYSHQQALRLTHALGDELDFAVLPDYLRELDLAPNEVLLLCTDGVSKQLTEAQIVAAVTKRASQAAAEYLVTEAIRAGAGDNVTVSVVRCLPQKTARLSPVLLLIAIAAVLAILIGATSLLSSANSAPDRLPTRGPTLTVIPPSATAIPGQPTATAAAGQPTSTAAPSVTPSATPTPTSTSTPTNTPVPPTIPPPPTASRVSPTASPETPATGAPAEPSPAAEPEPTASPETPATDAPAEPSPAAEPEPTITPETLVIGTPTEPPSPTSETPDTDESAELPPPTTGVTTEPAATETSVPVNP